MSSSPYRFAHGWADDRGNSELVLATHGAAHERVALRTTEILGARFAAKAGTHFLAKTFAGNAG